jgi:RNA polymerase sigma factor (sigma-70 family)
MECLSQEERDVVALRFGADLPVKEIATTIGESVTTTEGRLYRALRKLKGELS